MREFIDLRMKPMKARAIAFLLICLLSLAAASAQEIKVELPRGLGYATSDPALISESAIIVSIPSGNEFYVGNRRISKDQLGAQISELLKQDEANRIVYIVSSPGADYGIVVDVLQIIRERDVEQFGLIVDRGSSSEVLRGVFLIQVPTMRDPGEDISKLKPNPLTLVASVSSALELKLNQDPGPRRGGLCFSSVPHGLGNDPGNLQKWLTCLFDSRTNQRAYKIDMETRTDVPLEQRIEKTVFVKAPRSVKYGDVLRVINALQGAKANPIGLQIDDLPN